MANNPYVNKVVYDGNTLIDISTTTAVESDVASGKVFFKSNGTQATGTKSGGGGTIDVKTLTNSSDTATSLQFTGMKGTPIAFFLRLTTQLSRSSSYSYYYITSVGYNGTSYHGNYWRRSNGTFYNDTSHYSSTYSGTTLTITSSASRGAAGGSFYNGSYELIYVY